MTADVVPLDWQINEAMIVALLPYATLSKPEMQEAPPPLAMLDDPPRHAETSCVAWQNWPPRTTAEGPDATLPIPNANDCAPLAVPPPASTEAFTSIASITSPTWTQGPPPPPAGTGTRSPTAHVTGPVPDWRIVRRKRAISGSTTRSPAVSRMTCTHAIASCESFTSTTSPDSPTSENCR